jgi:hypothetical protein
MTKQPNPSPSSIPMTDPRYPIWGRLFMCRVPRIAHYGTDYLEKYGLPSSGNRNVDRELILQPSLVYITINQMVDYYNESMTVAIVKQPDVKLIYEICQNYTFDWANRLHKSVFTHNVPFEDLIKIDEFAEAVYQFAGHEYGEDFARTFVPDNVMKDIIDLNKMFEAVDNRIKNKNKAKEDHYTVKNIYSPQGARGNTEEAKTKEPIKLPDRPSVRDIFMSYMDKSGMAGRVS